MKKIVIALLLMTTPIFAEAGSQGNYVTCLEYMTTGMNVRVRQDYDVVGTAEGLVIMWNVPGIEKPTFEYLDTIITNATTWKSNEVQRLKPESLKVIENIYVDFLTNMWTGTLHQYGIIDTNYVITVENTDTTQNMLYLIALRSIDFPTYNTMAGEFDRLKNTILSMGGKMADVKYHDLSNSDLNAKLMRMKARKYSKGKK